MLRSALRPTLIALAVIAILAISATSMAQEKKRPEPMKPKTTSAHTSSERVLSKKAIIDAPLAEVWHAWASSEGITAFWGVDSNIKLEIGGPYELFMGMTEPDESGGRGSEGCRVLSYIPMEMLSFEWNFPPAVPTLRNAHAKTFVVLRFKPLGDKQTLVRLYQLGWQQGEDWDKGYEYFDRAWSYVLDLLKKNAGKLAKPEPQPEPRRKASTDGDVKVTAINGPYKMQEFEIDLPASLPTVWQALATAEGMKRVFGMDGVEIDLRPGGKYGTWPGAPNKVLSFLTNDMLSTSGSAPEQFPNVRKGGTWSAYFLTPSAKKDGTTLRLVTMGWRDGDKEWNAAYDYFLKANAQYLNHLKKQLEMTKETPATGKKPARRH